MQAFSMWAAGKPGFTARAGALVLGTLLIGSALLPSLPARACVQIKSYIVAPAQNAEIPGNLVFFRVLDESDGVEFQIVDRVSGIPIATRIDTLAGTRVLTPETEIEPGRRLALVATLPDVFARPGTPPARVERARHAFTTTAHAEIVLKPARLEVVEDRGNEVLVRYELPDQTGSARHLLTFHASLDGQWLVPEMVGPSSATYLVHSSCDGTMIWSTCGDVRTVAEGSHELVVSAHVVGSSVQPDSVRMNVDTSCDDGCHVRASPRGARQGIALLLLALAVGRLRSRVA